MAFAFSRINAALGDDPQKQDIFGQQQTQAGTVDGAQAPGASGAPVKSSTAGDLGAASSGASGAPAGQAAAPSLEQGQAAGRAALRANQGKVAPPTVLDDVGQRISARQNALQSEADSYVSGQKAKQAAAYGSVDAGDYEAAVSGNDYSRGKVANLLGQKTINPIDGFAPTTDVDVDDSERLKSDRGLQELIARGQGPSYNQGESAFDLRALRKTPGFDQRLRDIGVQQEAARQLKRDISGTSQKAVEDYGASQLTAAQKAATDWLTTQGTSIDQANAKEAADYKAKIDALRAKGVGTAGNEIMQAIRDVGGEADIGNYAQDAAGLHITPWGLSDLSKAKLDPGQYLKFGDTPDASAFYDANEATRFNNISQILGRGGAAKVAGVGPAGPMYSFDSQAYKAALRKAARGLVPSTSHSVDSTTGGATTSSTTTTSGSNGNGGSTAEEIAKNAAEAESAKTPSAVGTVGGGIKSGPQPETAAGPSGPQPGDPDYVPDWALDPDAKGKHDRETAHWNVPGGGKIPIGITEGDKDALDPSQVFTNIAGMLTPVAEGARKAGVHPTQLAGKGAEGVGNVGKGIVGVGNGLGKAGGAVSDVGKSAMGGLANLDAKAASNITPPAALLAAAAKARANPNDISNKIMAAANQSKLDALGAAQTAAGNAAAAKAAEAAKNAVPAVIPKLSGFSYRPTHVPTQQDFINAANAPFDPSTLPDFSQIGATLDKAGGDAAKYGKEKGGSIAKTAKKIIGRG